ncbi:DUF423 domain-containing protein [Flavobacteriaceae bacterium F08102]|nr:DUF423 domain-containing protein [Flavobacteriaceae bacterium F08102]
MKNHYLFTGVCLGFLAVLLGAFGAHALKEVLSPERLQSFETAVRYQMYHAIVILFVNGSSIFNPKSRVVISRLFLLGILFFSGSIYAITAGIDPKLIWFITPMGGLLLLSAWGTLGWKVLKLKKS